jgi:primosomal protein N' (replication factor Y)
MAQAPKVAQVLLDTALPQLDHLFDYAIPEGLRNLVAIGQRVKVPLRAGARQAFGYIVRLSTDTTHQGTLSDISQIVSPVQMLTPQIYALARSLADRAAGNANDIIRLAIPTRQVRVEKEFFSSKPDSLGLSSSHPAKSSLHSRMSEPSRIALDALARPVRLGTGEWSTGWAVDLAERATAVLATQQSVIIVVPDHHDLTIIIDAVASFGVPSEQLIRVDAQQSNAQRYRSFLHTLNSTASIIVGNRSAVYAPCQNLGAIFVWDDSDPVLSEPLTPYVHARDAAIMRSELEHCDLVFASYARSLEVHRLVEMQYLTSVEVTEGKKSHARRVIARGDAGAFVTERIPELARRTLRAALEKGPVLVQVSSPGRAKAMFCRSCAHRQRCEACGGPLAPRSRGAGVDGVTCRWCKAKESARICDGCGASDFRLSGAGSELTVEQLQQQFPNTVVKRSDSANRRALVDSRPAIVVATRGAEPIAAEGYAAVILLDAESMLAPESLRAEEDALRAWCNASALARPDGTVVLTNVDGKLADAFVLKSTHQWMTAVLEERRILRFPPAVRVATISGSLPEVDKAVNRVSVLDGVDSMTLICEPGGTHRAVVRFNFNRGPEVALLLRAEVIANASVRRSKTRVAAQQQRTVSRLRVHMDDREVFDGEF